MSPIPSTDAVRENTQLSHWQERLRTVLGSVRVTTTNGESPGGKITTTRLSHIDVSRIESDAQRVTRTAYDPRRGQTPRIILVLLRQGTATLIQDHSRVIAEEGDLLAWDETRPYSLHCGGPFTALALRMSRSRLGLPDETPRNTGLSAFTSSAGSAKLLSSIISTLATSPASYDPVVAGRLADTVVDLLSVLLLERSRPGDSPTGKQAALIRRVREHIDQRLEDPALSPRTIAHDHHISVRYLHRLFQSEDTTIRRLIQQRRIEQSARELTRHELRTLPIATIALRWGFANPAHFSRAFRQRYGYTPMQWRKNEPGRK
ncbi:helix-turn-helix domain-containing protein [Streptomyces sp. NPDC091416]|uniref:helix-turn-helix domain-containing protein n=1 Tax=Streptomyces sp. NPDC091416 TaxID=3366003 RepID=UPI00380C1478